MNLKKLISSFSVLAIMVQLMVPVSASAAWGDNDAEFSGSALPWGFTNGLTSFNTTATFNGGGTLTREQAAKFVNSWVKNVRNNTPAVDNAVMANFADEASMDPTLTQSVKDATMRKMFKSSTQQASFYPKRTMSRAEFMTVIVRSLKGFQDETTSPWYANYFKEAQALGMTKELDVMAQSRSILRGEAMLMLYRLSNGGTQQGTGSLNDILCQLLGTCTTGSVATGQIVGVVQGVLNVAVSPMTPASRTIPRVAAAIQMSIFELKNTTTQDITISTLELQRFGAGAPADFTNVALYNATNNTLLADGRTVNITTNKVVFTNVKLTIKAGETFSLGVRADIQGAASNAHGFSIPVGGIIANVSNVAGLPAAGNQFTLADVSVGTYTISARSLPIREVNIGTQGAQICRFNILINSVETAKLQAITLTLAGNASPSIFGNLKLIDVATNNVIGMATSFSRIGGYDRVHFAFDQSATGSAMIDRGGDRTFAVVADINGGRNADTFGCYLTNAGNLLSEGGTYGVNLSANSGAGLFYLDQTISTLPASTKDLSSTANFGVLKAGKLTFTASSVDKTKNITKGTNDVLLGAWNVTSASEVEIRTLAMTLSGTTATSYLVTGGISTFTNLRLVMLNSSGAIVSILGSVSDPVTNGATSYAMTFRDTFNLSAGTTTHIGLVANVPSSVVTAGSYNVVLNPADTANNFRELSSNQTITSADIVPTTNIASNISTLIPNALSVTYGATPASVNYIRGQNNADLATVNFNANAGGDLKILTLTMQFSGGTIPAVSGKNYVLTMQLYDGATMVGSAQSFDNNGNVVFTNLNYLVPNNTSKSLTVRGSIISSSPTTATPVLKVVTTNVDAIQVIGGSTVTVNSIPGTPGSFGVITGASVRISNETIGSKYIPGNTTASVVAKFNIRPSFAGVDLNTITFALSGSNAAPVNGSFKLLSANNTVLSTNGSFITTASSGVSFVRFTLPSGSPIVLPKDIDTKVQVSFDVVVIGSTVSSNSFLQNTQFSMGVFIDSADSTDDIDFTPSGVAGVANLKDANYPTDITLTGGTILAFNGGTGLFGDTHTLTRQLIQVATAPGADAIKPLILNITNPGDTINLSGITLKCFNCAGRFSNANFDGNWYMYNGSSLLASGTTVAPQAAANMSTLGLTFNMNGVVINPNTNTPIRIEFEIPVTTIVGNVSSAYFYLANDTNPGTAGNFVWYDGVSILNGYQTYPATINGYTFN